MKAVIMSYHWTNREPEIVRIELHAPHEEATYRLMEAGDDVYVYPKSRWGMFLDWLLKA